MFLALGIFALIVAIVALVFNLKISYDTHGGALGQVPCIAAATIQVPLLSMLGLSLIDKAGHRLDLEYWQWGLLWLAQTVAIAVIATWVGRLGERRSQRNPDAER